MNPDPERYLCANEVALHKAGIDKDSCHSSVEEAKREHIQGWEQAESYLKQLEELYYSADEDDISIIDDDNFNLYIDKDFAISWQPDSHKLSSIKPITYILIVLFDYLILFFCNILHRSHGTTVSQ